MLDKKLSADTQIEIPSGGVRLFIEGGRAQKKSDHFFPALAANQIPARINTAPPIFTQPGCS